jgi:hypothetical protein
VKLAEKMEQCSNQINPFVSSENRDLEKVAGAMVVSGAGNEKSEETLAKESGVPEDSVAVSSQAISESGLLLATDSLQQDSTMSEESFQEEVPTPEIIDLPREEEITFNINGDFTYRVLSNFRTEEGRAYFEEGSAKQKELDSVVAQTEKLRENYGNVKSRSEKDSIGQQILALEGETFELNRVVKQLFMLAKNAENEYWQEATEEEKNSFGEELDALANKTQTVNYAPIVIPETTAVIIPPILLEEGQAVEEISEENESGISYKIQLGAYSRGIPASMQPVFKKISILRKVESYTDENGVVVYTTGNLTSYEDAVVMQKQVIQEGVKDCKIAAYLNGKRITLEQAKELDKNR